MSKRNIVVIGASAGGVVALTELFKSIPDDFEACIFVVLHLSAFSHSAMPQILSRCGRFKAIHPEDGQKMRPNVIYIAPPDHHLLIEKDHILVKKGPKENRFRPSIDALFRSAAYNHGSRVVGLVLSGLMDDGTSGLWSIKRQGGICIIQDPDDAQFPDMPRNVMEFVDVDYKVPLAEVAGLLNQLTKETAIESPAIPDDQDMERMGLEFKIAAQDNAFNMKIMDRGPLTPLTCPECNGALVKFTEGKIIRFRCHTGHGFTNSALLASVSKSVEENLWKTVRALEEAVIILQQTARQYEDEHNIKAAGLFYQKAVEIYERAKSLRLQIFDQEQFSEDLRFQKSSKG